MAIKQLDNLAQIGKLKVEPPSSDETEGLIRSGLARLEDAKIETLSIASRFDLAYNAAHALSLAALRKLGYRSDSRYVVFQCLPHTLGLANTQWRILDKAHKKRNLSEYEGAFDIDENLLEALIRTASLVAVRVQE